MTSEKRMLLFISLSEPSLVKDSYLFSQEIKGTDLYYYYTKNIEKALKYKTLRTKKMKYYYDSLSFNAKNMEEYFKEYSKVYFLATQSYERYYLNPLVIEKGDTNLVSLGQLLFKFDGQMVPFNSIVNKGNYSLGYKKNAVKENVKIYQQEMYEIIEDKVKMIKDKKLTRRRLNFSNVLSIIELCCCIFFSAFMIFVFLLPKFKTDLLAKPFSTNNSTLIFVYFIGLMIYLSLYIITASWHNRLYEPIFYTRRFLMLKKKTIYSLIDKKCLQIEKYFNSAIEKKKPLKKDIYVFSGYDDSIIDFSSISDIHKGITSKGYIIFSAIKNIFFGIMVLLTIILGAYLIFLRLTKGSLFI